MVAVQQKISGRARIVAAARHLFSTLGFHQTPMADLALEADVSGGQIYRHFKGKSEIILAIVEEDIDGKLEELVVLRDRIQRGEIEIGAGLAALCQLALAEEREALSFEILAEAHRNPPVGAVIEILCVKYRTLVRDIARCAHPDMSEAGLDAAEELLLACMFGLAHRGLSAPRMTARATAEQTGKLLLGALRCMD